MRDILDNLWVDRNSFLTGVALGAVSGFVVAGIAAVLMGLVAHLVTGSGGPRFSLSRCMLIIGLVALDLAVGLGVRDWFGFLFGWMYSVLVFAVVHLMALGLTYSRRRPSCRSRLPGRAAWLGFPVVGLFLVFAFGRYTHWNLVILAAFVLLVDVACLRMLVTRRSAEIPISNRPTTDH